LSIGLLVAEHDCSVTEHDCDVAAVAVSAYCRVVWGDALGGEGFALELEDEAGVVLEEALDGLGVFFVPDGTGGIDEQAAGADEVGGVGEDVVLEFAEGVEVAFGLVVAGFGSTGEDAGVGAGDVGEDAVVAIGEEVGLDIGRPAGLEDVEVGEAALVGEGAEGLAAAGVDVDGVDAAGGACEIGELDGLGTDTCAAVEDGHTGGDVSELGDEGGGGVLRLGEALEGPLREEGLAGVVGDEDPCLFVGSEGDVGVGEGVGEGFGFDAWAQAEGEFGG
jgi:hypothetical protein